MTNKPLKPLKILFCSDALLIDGVTSYILHVGVALQRAGYRVAVLGRWAGTGFQKRLREEGIEVIQCLSLTVGNVWFDMKARQFDPDIIMTDSRRSFALATRLKQKLGKPVVTYFLDHLEKTDKKGRDVDSLKRWSDMWVGAEEPILNSLRKVNSNIPVATLSRPLSGVVQPSLVPPVDDSFNLVCFGRLSGYKTPGMFHILENISELKKLIPSLKVTIVGGGGWRVFKFKAMAMKINSHLGDNCVRVTGIQPDPRRWINQAHLICAGSTSALEAALAKRPVICFTSYWLGRITPDNIDEALGTYFGERGGHGLLSDRKYMDMIIPEIVKVYDLHRKENLDEELQFTRDALLADFDEARTVEQFSVVVRKLGL